MAETADTGSSKLITSEVAETFAEVLDGRSIRYLYDIGGRSVRLVCRVRGKIDASRSMKNALFVTLDTTDGLQLVFDRADVGEERFSVASRLGSSARLEAEVETEYNESRKPPIRLLVRSFTLLPTDTIASRRTAVKYDQAKSKIELASVARSAANFLSAEGWIEAAPLTISTSLDQSLDPLQVVFPGLGAETSLVVSPLAELAEIAQLTGSSAIFSVSRLYSRAIRDGFTSPESLAVVVVRLRNEESDEVDLDLAQNLINSALQPVKNRLSERDREWLASAWERRRSTSLEQINEVSKPVHQIFRSDDLTAFRSLWPHPISLVEGHVRRMQDGCFHCITLHCERILHLVSGESYRRLQEGPKFA